MLCWLVSFSTIFSCTLERITMQGKGCITKYARDKVEPFGLAMKLHKSGRTSFVLNKHGGAGPGPLAASRCASCQFANPMHASCKSIHTPGAPLRISTARYCDLNQRVSLGRLSLYFPANLTPSDHNACRNPRLRPPTQDSARSILSRVPQPESS